MPFLDWVNKNQAVSSAANVPYHLLQLEKTYGDSQAAQQNLIIQGDNLQALKALLPFYTGKVKCIFIDPPYNTGSAFEHYDDKLEHSQWLSMIYPRLALLRDLLAEDGSIWITIDDSEGHYLKVLCDEIFGRINFIGNVTWQKTTSVHNNAVYFSSATDLILSYSKNIDTFKMGRVARSERNATDYSNADNDPRGPWASSPLHVSLTSGQRGKQYALTGKSSGLFPIISPHQEEIYPPKGRCWAYSPENIQKFEIEKLIWWGKDGRNQPRLKRFLNENKEGVVPITLWLAEDVGHNQEAKAENAKLLSEEVELFSTPKPERLLKRIIDLSTTEGDIVLDSFLGSGTTAAVAHKMGRKYIGVEMGEHAQTHCVPRLQKVIEGEQGGISTSVNWQGGGGFSFYTLGEAVFDANGHISPSVRFNALAAYIWLLETKTAIAAQESEQSSPFIGEHEGVAYYLLYNGILGDRRPNGGNVLTNQVLAYLESVHPHAGKKVIFGEASRISDGKLALLNISFKQIPYELHERI